MATEAARWVPWRLSLVLLALILVQGAFGAFTVTLRLWPQVVTLHLLGGMAVMGGFLWLHMRVRHLSMSGVWRRQPRRLTPLWGVALGLLVLQLALGGWTSSNYAASRARGFLPVMPVVAEHGLGRGVSPDPDRGAQLSAWAIACGGAQCDPCWSSFGRSGTVPVFAGVGMALPARSRCLALAGVMGGVCLLQAALALPTCCCGYRSGWPCCIPPAQPCWWWRRCWRSGAGDGVKLLPGHRHR